MNWIDIAAALFLAFSAWNGYRRGLIDELSGFLALVAAGIAGFTYAGELDGAVRGTFHLGPGSAHVAGLLAFASVSYLIVWTAGFVLDRIAKLPLLNVINGVLGSALAMAKTVVILIAIDYVATLAPMSADLHADVDRSTVGRAFANADASIDDDLGSHLPIYLRPMWDSAMHHREETPANPASASESPAP